MEIHLFPYAYDQRRQAIPRYTIKQKRAAFVIASLYSHHQAMNPPLKGRLGKV